jgi:hypothetical protein
LSRYLRRAGLAQADAMANTSASKYKFPSRLAYFVEVALQRSPAEQSADGKPHAGSGHGNSWPAANTESQRARTA